MGRQRPLGPDKPNARGRVRDLTSPRSSRPQTLPAPFTRFIGREQQIDDGLVAVRDSRLITLTGPGGAGKTRLALEIASRLGEYHGATVFVELGAVVDPESVPERLVAANDLHERAGQSQTETLVEALRSESLLIVLDNCEHLVEACASISRTLLEACPGLKVLATSREPLAVPGERVMSIPPLKLPDPARLPPVDELPTYEAIGLFVDRAMGANRSFALTQTNARFVIEVCRRLDGLPLAIELAAAQIRWLSPQEIARHLDERFRLLVGVQRTGPARQQTLRSAVDWSYDLLAPRERVLFNRLSVFAGGWTLETAEVVVGDVDDGQPDVRTGIARLVDESLVQITPGLDGRTRYRMLETLREYAREHLAGAGEQDRMRDRHARFFLLLVEQAELGLRGSQQDSWLKILDQEHDNISAVLYLAVERCDAILGLRLATALWRFWSTRGLFTEGRNWLGRTLALEPITQSGDVRAKALTSAGTLAYQQGDTREAGKWYREALAINHRRHDQPGVANALNGLGNVATLQGDYARARDLLDESLSLRRELGDMSGVAADLNNLGFISHQLGDLARARALYTESLGIERCLENAQGIAYSLSNLGVLAAECGEPKRAAGYYDEALATLRELGDRWGIANALHNLGDLALDLGNRAHAASLYAESLEMWRDLGDRRGMAYVIEGFAVLAAAEGEFERSLQLAGVAAALREALAVPLSPAEAERYERKLQRVRGVMTPERAQRVTAEGRKMSVDRALEYALGSAHPAAVVSRTTLTPREREVATLVARGLTNKEIGSKLVISERTADTHVSNVLAKLGLRSRAQLAAWVAEQRMPQPP